MVVVTVRDEHQVNLRDLPFDGNRPPEMRDAFAQQGIGQQTHAVELDENRCVPDEPNDQ